MSLKQIFKLNTEPRHPCPHCFLTFTEKSSLPGHLLICPEILKPLSLDEITKLKEPNMHKQTVTKNCPENHKQQKIVKSKPIHKCPYCNKAFSRKSGLTRHQKTCPDRQKQLSPEEITKLKKECGAWCSYCDKTFLRKDYLTDHLKTCPERLKQLSEDDKAKLNAKTKRPCQYCNKAFSRNSGLTRHLKICPDRLQQLSPEELVKVKELKVTFVCDVCGKECSTRYSLKRHKDSHAPVSERKYPCSGCDARFVRADTLKKHQPICPAKKHPHSQNQSKKS